MSIEVMEQPATPKVEVVDVEQPTAEPKEKPWYNKQLKDIEWNVIALATAWFFFGFIAGAVVMGG